MSGELSMHEISDINGGENVMGSLGTELSRSIGPCGQDGLGGGRLIIGIYTQ